MLLPDVNVLIGAYREDASDHIKFKSWLDNLSSGDESYGIATLVLSGFVRIVTSPRIFAMPTPTSAALDFAEKLVAPATCVLITPGPRHWDIFVDLCRAADARGNLVPDAYLAALAIESGSEWITVDGDFARFPGLRWRRPF